MTVFPFLTDGSVQKRATKVLTAVLNNELGFSLKLLLFKTQNRAFGRFKRV